jgi:hypothetical protein
VNDPVVAPVELKLIRYELAAEAVFVTTILIPLNAVPAAFQVSVRL